jgi:hypothetical protein
MNSPFTPPQDVTLIVIINTARLQFIFLNRNRTVNVASRCKQSTKPQLIFSAPTMKSKSSREYTLSTFEPPIHYHRRMAYILGKKSGFFPNIHAITRHTGDRS